jgi:hypothetical protein
MRLAYCTPTAPPIRARLSAERQLPIVRPMGEPKRVRRGDAEIASGGNVHAAAHRPAFHQRNGGAGNGIDGAHAVIDVAFIVDALLAGRIVGEFADIGARDEGLAAHAAKGGDADRGICGKIARGIAQIVPHLAGQRIMSGRIAEADAGDRPLLFVNDARGLAHCADSLAGNRPLATSSARISSLCWLSSGGMRTCCGVPRIFTGKPSARNSPSTGWGSSAPSRAPPPVR